MDGKCIEAKAKHEVLNSGVFETFHLSIIHMRLILLILILLCTITAQAMPTSEVLNLQKRNILLKPVKKVGKKVALKAGRRFFRDRFLRDGPIYAKGAAARLNQYGPAGKVMAKLIQSKMDSVFAKEALRPLVKKVNRPWYRRLRLLRRRKRRTYRQ